jgi:Rha family phage regulatory protein
MARKNLDSVEPINLIVENDKPMASSLQVAKHFGKQHNNILRDIESLKNDVPSDWFSLNFEPTEISVVVPASGGIRKDPAYMMTRDGFAFMAMGFTGKKASKWKIDYLTAFNAMEAAIIRCQAQPSLPSPPPEPAQLPERYVGDSLQPQRIVIDALLKFWAANDDISVTVAQKTLCAALKIRSIEKYEGKHFWEAWGFIMRSIFLSKNVYGDFILAQEREEKMYTAIDAIIEATVHFTGCVGLDFETIIKKACEIESDIFLEADLQKMFLIAWGTFQYWYGFSMNTTQNSTPRKRAK